MEPAADIYALGVLLYQMVAGDLRRPLPDGEVRAPEDWILDGVIQRCTAPLRTERFLTAGEVASRLRGMSDQRAKFRWAIVFGVAAVVIAFALVQWLWPTGVLLVPLDENTVIEMRRIRGGEFSMGSSDSEPGREANEGPVHSVSVSPIHLGTAEVTVGQYRLFLEETAHPEPPDWEEQLQYPDFPVVWVSWDDAQAFCQWLTQRESAAFALPTEAQWEFACRAGASSAFAFGETLSPGQENYFELPDEFSSEQLASPEATDGPAMLPSGAGAANGWGLIDMHGNVSEWCRDWYSPEFYSAANASGTDPFNSTPTGQRAIRGGNWVLPMAAARAAVRRGAPPDTRADTLGFRIARLSD
jgi:formylglycine-generating enzyme required for sulfatase activity